MTIFRYSLRRIFRNKLNLMFLSLFPLGCIFTPKAEYWPYLPYGYHYFGILLMFIGIRMASILLEDRLKGVVKRLAIAPVSYFQYLSQNLLAYAVIVIILCVITVFGGVLIGQELYRPLMLLFLFISFSITSLAVAIAWLSLFRSKELASLVYFSLVLLAATLGGIIIPLQLFPEMLTRIAVVMPTYWLAEGMNWIVNGMKLTDFLLMNGVLWLYTLIFLILGSVRRMH